MRVRTALRFRVARLVPVVIVSLLSVGFARPARAGYEPPLPQLVGDADVVVLGTSRPVAASARDSLWNTAYVDVDEVLHPRGLAANRLEVEWRRGNPALDTLFVDGTRAIWLLRSSRYGTFQASVGCRRAVEDRELVQLFLDVRPSARLMEGRDGETLLKVTFQNLSSRVQQLPAVVVSPDGVVRHDERLSFDMTAGGLPTAAGARMQPVTDLEPMQIAPYGAEGFTLNVEDLWSMAGISAYMLRVRVDGVELFRPVMVRDAR